MYVWIVSYVDASCNTIVKMFKKEPVGLLKSSCMISYEKVWIDTER